jgi:hypothetical protein
MCSDLSPKAVWKSECLNGLPKSCAWISLSFSKVELSNRKASPGHARPHRHLTLFDIAANKDDLLDMITHGADKIINSSEE